MSKNIKKIVVVILCFMLIFGCFISSVYGYDWDFEQFDGYSNKIGSTGEKLENTGATIIKIIEVLSLGIAIFMLVIYGIMYIFTSTTEKKVEMKKNMPNYIAGVILTFSAAVLLEIVSSFINENINK